MDTDYLSKEAYNLICIAASFDDSLKALMGASCSQCKDEKKYLKGLLDLYDEIEKDQEEYFEEWGRPVNVLVQGYKKKPVELRNETQKVINMDTAQKHFEEW